MFWHSTEHDLYIRQPEIRINLLNLKLYTGASLSYVTYGQNVPDDIEEFNPQGTVKPAWRWSSSCRPP